MALFDRYAHVYDRFIELFRVHRPQRFVELLEISCRDSAYSVLDIGGGTGSLAQKILMLQDNLHFTILDPSNLMLKRVPTQAKERAKIVTVQGQGEKLPFARGTFHRVMIADVLHHTQDPELVMKQAFQVLKSGGIMVVQEYNPEWLLNRLLIFLEKIIIDPSMQAIFPSDLKKWGREAGFSEGEIFFDKLQFFWKGKKKNRIF